MIKALFTFILVVHALIHIMGFAKAFNLAEISQLTQHISRPAGVVWLLAALLFGVAAVSFLAGKDWWWIIGAIAVAVSQALIIMYWKDAKFGAIANIIIAIGIVIAYGAWSFNKMARSEIKALVESVPSESGSVSTEMLDGVPLIVGKWLERSGVVGKESIRFVNLKQTGQMRTTPDGKWMKVEAEQWFAPAEPRFVWLADVQAAPGIYLAGRDKYEAGKGHMLIKLLSLFAVADSKGPEIDQGTMLRYLAEIVWFPSAALSPYIQWEVVDATTAKAAMSYEGVTASGIFRFNADGDVASFEAERYYDRKTGPTLETWVVSLAPDGYKEFEGIRIPAGSEVTWKLKEGDFTWFKLEITDIRYNF